MSYCSNFTKCQSSKSIFSNCFTLNIENERIQEIYEERIRDKKYIMLIYLILSTIFILVCLILAYVLETTENGDNLKVVKYSGYVCSFFQLLSYILYFVQFKFKSASTPFLYVHMTTVIMTSFYFGKCLRDILTKEVFDDYSLLVHCCYLSVISSYIVFADNNFIRVLVTVIINLSFLIFSIVGSSYENADIIKMLLLNIGLSFIVQLILFYSWCRISKESLYYKEKLEMQKNWIYDVLNHWNSGVIVYNVNKHKLKFFNDYLKKFNQFKDLNKNNEVSLDTEFETRMMVPIVHTLNPIMHQVNGLLTHPNIKSDHDILMNNNIFKQLFDINQNLPQELIIALSTEDFKAIIDLINKNYPSTEDNIFFKEFIFLGRINLNNESKTGIFELSMHGFNSVKGIFYEFMINDVTKTKQLEEHIIKEKTLLLGKISHEFKNPLIVVDEVVEELIENKNSYSMNQNELKRIRFIKNLSNYMIILVKDFEVIANAENSVAMYPTMEELELKNFLFDIQQIVETLIEKKNSNNVKFQLDIDENIDIMITDSIRLKQILINLLSNSVKFTDIGTIALKVELVKLPHSLLPNDLKIAKNKETKTNNNIITNDGIIDFHQNINSLLDKQNQNIDIKQSESDIYFRFSITDTGKGMPEHLIELINSEKIVKAFEKDNSKSNILGTGYGLNIVQRLCKLLNSKLYAKEKSEGSEFYFDILQENFEYPSKATEIKKEDLATTSNQQKIIIVNDKAMHDYDVDNKNAFEEEQVDEEVTKYNLFKSNNSNNSDIKLNKKLETFKNKDKLIFDHYPENTKRDLKRDVDDKEEIFTSRKNKFFDSFQTVKQLFDCNLPPQFLETKAVSSIQIINNNDDLYNDYLQVLFNL